MVKRLLANSAKLLKLADNTIKIWWESKRERERVYDNRKKEEMAKNRKILCSLQ